MIYLNNAATTYPKPQCVLEAHTAALCSFPTGQFRSTSLEKAKNADIFEICRKNIGKLLGISQWNRIFFTSGATDALNQLLYGLNLKGKKIITTQTEHNSVLRPLFNGALKENEIIILPCDKWGKVEPKDLEEAIDPQVGAFVLNHCSNVTGMIQDAAALGKIAKKYGILYLIDASQSAGCIPIEADKWQADGLVFTGHKSLLGPQGTGGYYIREEIPFIPSRYGGTGRDSKQLTYEQGDYEYEVGTLNGAGISALNAGVSYALEEGVETIAKREQTMMKKLYEGLSAIEGIILYGNKEHNLGPVLSMNVSGLKPSDTAYILQNGYEIIVRTGIHCAPLIHKAMGTQDYGTVRVSISALTKAEEIQRFLDAVGEIALVGGY